MPFLTPSVTTEHDALATFLAAQLDGVRAAVFGLTDDEARATPTRSQLSVGALLKHITYGLGPWFDRVEAAPGRRTADRRSVEDAGADFDDQLRMRDNETLADLLADFERGRDRVIDGIRDAGLSLDTTVPKPDDAPWWPTDVEGWSVRWVLLHLIEETARHAGHADIIREQIDGETMSSLVAALDGVQPSAWVAVATPHDGSHDARRSAEGVGEQGP